MKALAHLVFPAMLFAACSSSEETATSSSARAAPPKPSATAQGSASAAPSACASAAAPAPESRETLAKAALADESKPHAGRALMTLMKPQFGFPEKWVRTVGAVSGEGIDLPRRSALLFYGVFLEDDSAAKPVTKLCHEDAHTLAVEVEKAKPEDASATVSKRCHLEKFIDAADLPRVNPWYLLFGALLNDKLEAEHASDAELQLVKLVPFVLDEAEVRNMMAAKKMSETWTDETKKAYEAKTAGSATPATSAQRN